MHALLDQGAAAVGVAATPDFQWVYALTLALVVVNSLCYVTLLHVLYALLLGRMEGVHQPFGAPPVALVRALSLAAPP